jgi:hypothetical protein
MKVRCDNGLCDRLRVVFSYLGKTRQDEGRLEVCWIVNDHCNGHFLDLFKPLRNVKFTDDPDNVDFDGWKPCPGFDPVDKFIYQELSLLDDIRSSIDELRSRMGEYIAVHVRRTDKCYPENRINKNVTLTTEDEFFAFIDRKPDVSVFLATDNRETQDEFKERYGDDRIFCSSDIDANPQELRHTGLDLATVDLFTCIEAKAFLGTRLSGFSDFIDQTRNYRNGVGLLL